MTASKLWNWLQVFHKSVKARLRQQDSTEGSTPWDEMLSETSEQMFSETSEHFLQRPCGEWGGLQQDPGCSLSTWWWALNHGEEAQTQTVWPHLKILWHDEDNSAVDSERSKKETEIEEEVGRQHQRRDRNWVWRFPWGDEGNERWLQRYLWCLTTVKFQGRRRDEFYQIKLLSSNVSLQWLRTD